MATRVLDELAVLTISSFPHAIIPNKLLQEFRALVKGAEMDIPLFEEVAADTKAALSADSDESVHSFRSISNSSTMIPYSNRSEATLRGLS